MKTSIIYPMRTGSKSSLNTHPLWLCLNFLCPFLSQLIKMWHIKNMLHIIFLLKLFFKTFFPTWHVNPWHGTCHFLHLGKIQKISISSFNTMLFWLMKKKTFKNGQNNVVCHVCNFIFFNFPIINPITEIPLFNLFFVDNSDKGKRRCLGKIITLEDAYNFFFKLTPLQTLKSKNLSNSSYNLTPL